MGELLGVVLSGLIYSHFFAWANKKISKTATHEKSIKVGAGLHLALSVSVLLLPSGTTSFSVEAEVLRVLAVIGWFPFLLKRARKKDAAAAAAATTSAS